MILISNINHEGFSGIFSKNVCSGRTNLGLLLYQLNQFQCNIGMMSNG